MRQEKQEFTDAYSSLGFGTVMVSCGILAVCIQIKHIYTLNTLKKK